MLEVQGDELARAANVLDHATSRFGRVPSLDCLENRLVLLHVLGQQSGALSERGPREVTGKAPAQVGDRVVQPARSPQRRTRCPLESESAPRSTDEEPPLVDVTGQGHFVACHLVRRGTEAPRIAESPVELAR